MAVSLVCAVLNRFLFFPANVSTMNAMYKIEKDAGVGQQVNIIDFSLSVYWTSWLRL